MIIIKVPNKILSQKADEIPADEIPYFKPAIKDMFSLLHRYGGVGLAAPQVGISKRFFVWIDSYKERCVMVNPVVVSSFGKIKLKESCLSIPNIQRYVNRKRVVTVEFLNEAGYAERCRLKNLYAAIIQHEIDHLNGITILDNAKKRNAD